MKFHFAILVVLLILPHYSKAGEDDDFEENDNDSDKPTPKDKDNEGKEALKKACGKSATLEPLHGGNSPVLTPKDLECKFDMLETCAWSNAKNQSIKWGFVEHEKVDNKTFRDNFDTTPGEGGFAAAPSGSAEESDEGIMVSGPIPCQKEAGQLSFGHYLTDGTKLKVCKRSMDKQTIEGSCQDVTGSSKKKVMAIPGGTDPFRIAFIASGFQDGGVVLVQNIEYGAKFCQNG